MYDWIPSRTPVYSSNLYEAGGIAELPSIYLGDMDTNSLEVYSVLRT